MRKNKRQRRFQRAAIVLCLLCTLPTAASNSSRRLSVGANGFRWQPLKLTNGSPVLLEMTAPSNVRSISANWLGHSFNFFPTAQPKSWCALAGVPLQTAPGIYDLRLVEVFADGRTAEIGKKVKIEAASYPKITLRVAQQFTEPSATQLAAIAADKDLKEKIFREVSGQRLWSGSFIPPVSATISDVFGTERVFNQEVQSRHQGLDYAVPPGTPVRAINGGVVILAREMFFEGNCVVIDHGQGLLSLYLHLSEFRVKEGEPVQSGQIVAASGGSGRATGPHLHLAIRWQGTYLNPAILLKLSIPD
jgi:murein DD-endopeptidase MepM/ murein hydrolase activator NlpD